jgi:chemotaxis protein CheZ
MTTIALADVARLTRGLHEALAELQLDSRLTYVADVTEQAAHRTLDLVEQARAQLETIGKLGVDTAPLRGTLNQLAVAQEYQDLSGQVIKRVVTLACGVESALLDLLRASGGSTAPLQKTPAAPLSGLHGPAVPGGPKATSQQDADALLASLGF